MSTTALEVGLLGASLGVVLLVADMVCRARPKLASALRMQSRYRRVAVAMIQVTVMLSAFCVAIKEVARVSAQIADFQEEMKQHREVIADKAHLGPMVLDTANTLSHLVTEHERLTKAYVDLVHNFERHMEDYKSTMDQMQSVVQSLERQKEDIDNLKGKKQKINQETGSDNTKPREQGKKQRIRWHPLSLDGVMKALRVESIKVQIVKLRFPWVKLKKAKNVNQQDARLV